MYKKIFNHVKRIIPKISETEIIALKSGGTSIDRYIFEGKMNYQQLYSPINHPTLSKKTEDDLHSLLKITGEDNIYPSKNIHNVMKELGNRGFLSMIIDKKYGGNRIPIELQSQLLSKISSYNPSLGVATMVPNSLGPAELLQHYGTDEQKNYFLPNAWVLVNTSYTWFDRRHCNVSCLLLPQNDGLKFLSLVVHKFG